VGTGKRLPWDEVTGTSTGDVLATRRARIGEWGLTEALQHRQGGEMPRGSGIPMLRWRTGGRQWRWSVHRGNVSVGQIAKRTAGGGAHRGRGRKHRSNGDLADLGLLHRRRLDEKEQRRGGALRAFLEATVCQVEKMGGVGTVAHRFKGGGDVEQGGGTGLLHAARRWGRVPCRPVVGGRLATARLWCSRVAHGRC
jgi:hypothetical protein